MTTAIIYLCGAAGAGKSTSATFIQSWLTANGIPYVDESLAGPLKKMVTLAFPEFVSEDLYGSSAMRGNKYPYYVKAPVCVRCNAALAPCTEGTVKCPRCNEIAPVHLTPRYALQTLGTEWGRRLDVNIWCKALTHRIQQWDVGGDLAVTVSDVRFRNEVDFLHKQISDKTQVLGIFLTRNMPAKGSKVHGSEAEIRALSRDKRLHVIDNETFDSPTDLADPLCELLERTLILKKAPTE